MITTIKDFINESLTPWKDGFENTKLFETNLGYIQGCKSCDKIVKLDNLLKNRQMVGNVYQSLCNCSICKKYIVFDEHKLTRLELFLKQ